MRNRFAAAAMALMAVVGLCAPANAQERGAAVFADNFDTPATFVENWKANPAGLEVGLENGCLEIAGNGGVTPNVDVPDDFELTVRVAIVRPGDDDPERPAGFGGVGCGIGRFLVRPDGQAWLVYRLPDEERSRGTLRKIDGFEFGQYVTLNIIRRTRDDMVEYLFSVNGQDVGQAIVPAEKAGTKPDLTGYRETLRFDDFQLFALAEKDASPNLVVNSSFEYLQEGMPTYYDTDRRNYTYNAPYEDFLATLAIDRDVKRSGENSLRLVKDDSVEKGGAATWNTGVVVGKPLTFSVYLKAEKEDFPVELIIWEMRSRLRVKPVRLTTGWERYTFTLDAAAEANARFGINFTAPGVVWMDDLQAEIAAEASPYRASDLDRRKFAALPAAPAPESFAAPLLDAAPVLDGDLSDWTDKALCIDKFYETFDASPLRTVAWLACDREALYVGVRAFVNDPAEIKDGKVEDESFAVFSQDNIEILLDPGQSRKSHYQLAVGAGGARTGLGPGRNPKWRGSWQAAVRRDDDAKTIDYEVRLPLGLFAAADADGNWGFNLGRHDAVSQSYAAIMPMPSANFHLVDRYPTLRLPEAATRPVAFGCVEPKVSADDGAVRFLGVMENRTGEKRAGILAATSLDGATTYGEAAIELAPGRGEVAFELAGYNPADGQLRLALRAGDGDDARILGEQCVRPRPFAPLAFRARYSYYMANETVADFRAETTLAVDGAAIEAVAEAGGRSVTVAAAERFTFELPIDHLPEGEHPVTLELRRDGRALAAARVTLVKKPFRANAPRVNQYRRAVVMGERAILPFMPLLGVHAGEGERLVELGGKKAEFLARHGFRYAMPVVNWTAQAGGDAFMKRAEELGIVSLYWHIWKRDADDGDIANRARDLDKWESIFAQLVIDEPELYMKSEDTAAWIAKMRGHFTRPLVMMNNTVIGIPNRFAGLDTDILMLDDYLTNRENRDVAGIVNQADMMWTAGAAEYKPCYYFLAGNNMHNHYREPTAAEQVAQTYGALAAGVTGFAYFLGLPSYPAHWDAYVALNRELLELEPAILSDVEVADARVSDQRLRALTRVHDGRLYIVVVNVDAAPSADVAVTLPAGVAVAAGAAAEVLFEDRSLPVAAGVLRDDFPPHSRRVYRLPLE